MANIDDIAAQQVVSAEKKENATEGISTILSQLSTTPNLQDDAKEAVDNLVKTVCTTSPSIKSSLEVKNTSSSSPVISSEQVKLICQQVRELFNDLSSFRTELRSMDTVLHNHIKKLEEDMISMKAKHDEDMKAMKSKHETDIAKVKGKVNDNDQYPRKNNLIFGNVWLPDWAKQRDCNGFELANYVAFNLNTFLPMLHTPVTPYNIDITHPLRNNRDGKSVIIVRFVNRHIRHDIYNNRESLLNLGISFDPNQFGPLPPS